MVRDLGPVGRGTSGARFFEAADAQHYHVKLTNNAHGIHILANELVVSLIAQELGLPCPRAFFIVMHGLLSIPGVQVGPHFGTEKIDLFPGGNDISSAVNNSEFPGVILCDVLTCNHDRNNPGNYLVSESPDGPRFVMIDHGHCFGYTWDENTIEQRVEEWNPKYLLPAMAQSVTGADPFTGYLDRIEGLSSAFFEDVVDMIPDSWGIGPGKRAALVHFLDGRRDRLRGLLEEHRDAFPGWI